MSEGDQFLLSLDIHLSIRKSRQKTPCFDLTQAAKPFV
jgi:hypothetical protein